MNNEPIHPNHELGTDMILERKDREPDELTIFPSDISREERVTTWVSAEEGSFVELGEWR